MSRWAPYQLHDATQDHASAWAPRQPMVGAAPMVGAVYVADAELNKFGESVGLMSGDVNAAATKERANWAKNIATGAAMKACFAAGLAWDSKGNKCLQEEDPDHRTYGPGPGLGQPLTDFQTMQWTPFVMRWNDYVTSAVHLPGTFYNDLLPSFRILHDTWTVGLKQKTRAEVPIPPEGGIPWGWIIGGAALLMLPFYLPVLTGLGIYLVKGKIPGTEFLPGGGQK